MAQQNNGNDLEKLYRAVSDKFDIGDFDSFSSKMQTSEDRLRFYNAVSDKGFDLGDYNAYEERLGKFIGVPAQGSADTSVESVEPTGLTEASPQGPTGQEPMQNGDLSDQSLTGDQFLAALNERNRRISGATGLEEVIPQQTEIVIPEGTEIIPNAVGPDGLPVYAKINEDGTYIEGGTVLAPVDLSPTREDIKKQQQPSAWESIKNSITNIGNQLEGFDDRLTIFTTDVYEKIFGKDLGGKIYSFLDEGIIAGLPGQGDGDEDLLNRRRDEAYAELQRLGEEALPTLGLTDSFNSGRIENLAAGVVNAISAIAGTAIVSVPTGGAGLITEMTGGALYDYNTAKAEAEGITPQELIERGEADFWTPFTIGAAGAGLEAIGLKGVTSSITRNLTGSLAKKATVLGMDWNKEGMTEWVQGGLSAYNETIARGGTFEQATEALVQHMGSEQGLEEYLMGLVGSAGASGLGRLSKGVINKVSRDKINKNSADIEAMVADMSNTEDPSVRSSLLDVIAERANEILQAKQESNAIESSLTDEQRTEINRLNSIIDSIDEGLSNSDLSDVSTEALTARKTELEQQIESLINTQPPSTEVAPEVVDERIIAYRENNPNIELENPMDTISESVENVMSRIDDNIPVDPVSAKETSDTLYAKYKELSEMKSDPNRTLTIAEIDGYIEQLGADIEVLENYTTEGAPLQEQIQENETTETEIQPETTQEVSEVSLESSEVAPVAESTAVTKELVVDDSKQRQFDIIQASNPAPNAVNTWVRSPEDILTAEEAFTPAREDGAVYPDFSVEDMDVALSSGEVTVYSSYPIADGVFVTPSKMNAESYSGDGKVYSKTIPISDVAWIDEGEGQYAPVSISEPVSESALPLQADFTQSEKPQATLEFANEAEYYQYVSTEETNPDIVAQAYSTYSDQGDLSYVESGIAEYGIPRVNEEDYNRWGDPNNMDRRKRRRWIDRNNTQVGVDVMAQEVSDRLGLEVTPEDIIEFIDKFPNSQSIRDAQQGSVRYALAQRYAELTGNNLTRNRIRQSLINIDKGRTDQERFEASGLPDQGVTFEDTQARQEYEAETDPRPASLKGALKGVSDRLAKTGLAKSIQMKTSEEISSELGVDGGSVNGYVDSDGNIVVNSERASLDTPIHEISHVWERTIEQSNPVLHARGMELIAGPDGKVYVDYVRDTQPGLEGRELYKEALAQAIGDRGARLIESQKNGPIKEWLKRAWEFIGNLVGISGMTPTEIANLTLNQYADAVATDLLQGKPLVKLPSGDIVIRTTARTESQMDKVDKFMADFVQRMKAKNGVNFQGTVSGELSAQDFTDLTTYFRYAMDKGLISTIDEARIMARSMGISSPAEVDMAFKLSKTRETAAVGFKKSEVSPETLKNTNFDKLSDEEYREFGKRLVDEGLVDPHRLVAEVIDTPRALQPWEVTALQYYRSNIESEMVDISNKLDSNDESYTYRLGGDTLRGYKAMAQRMQFINEALFDLEVAMLTTAHQQSAAFRLRSVLSDKDFNVVQFLAEMKARGSVDPAVEQRLMELSNELNVVRAKLKEKSRQVDELQEQISTGNINYTAQQPQKRRRVKPKKEVLSVIELTLDTIDPSAFGLPGMTFQANNTIRFQTNSTQSLSAAVSDAVASMKESISEGRLSVAEAIEQAVADINSAVGEGNWDSMKFKSYIANTLVGQSVPVRMKSPYVNTNGKLVVPGSYITDIAREGADTIDKMVERVSNDLGGRYSAYDIRNAISGYGRETAKNRTDLDRAISKAKRVARLLSQIEDLETKGKRLKTKRQIDNNDSEIEGLRQEVKRLEYDLEMTPEERDQLAEQRYNEGRRKYLERYIADIRQRIDDGDFAPKTRKNRYEEDSETTALRVEAERIKNEFKKEKYRHELETRPIDEKIREYAYDLIFNITRALSAGFDASAIGVQAFIFSAARPKQALGVLRSSMRGSFSEAEYDTYFANLQADPLYEVARKAKLNLQLPSFYQSVQEEQFKGSIPAYLLDYVTGGAGEFVAKMTGGDVVEARQFAQDKFNLAKIADRNYSLVLSKVRMDLFREFVGNQINKRGLDVEMDAAEVARIAEVVNTITMASKVPGVEGKTANDIVSMVMFSARKFIATWKVLGAWVPLAINNRQLLKDAYGGIIGKGLGTLFTIAAIPNIMGTLMAMYSDDEDEDDLYWYNKHWMNPKHSDFLKIRLGNTRISLFNGIDGNIVFATRFLSGEYMTSSSEAVKELGGASNNKTRGGLSWEYISNKFAPTTSILTNHFLYSDREKQESYERFKESFAPMWATGMHEQYVNTGNIGETMALGAAGFFGLAYNNYGGAEFAMGPGTDNIKARGIFDRSGLTVYDPGNGIRKYFNGTDESAVKGKNYDDIYLPAYQEFMREAVISNENNLSRDKHWEHKEDLVISIKREAYKHAELELSGVIFTGSFKNISYDGQKYVIPKSLYSVKADYIKDYMDKNKREIPLYVQDLKYEFSERAGVKPTKRYLEMLAQNELYKEAHREANARMIEDMENGKITLIPKDEYVSSEDNFEDE